MQNLAKTIWKIKRLPFMFTLKLAKKLNLKNLI